MSNASKEKKAAQNDDLVLREVWRIKDTLSASYDHDVDRLFAEARKRQEQSGRTVVNFQVKSSARHLGD